MADTSTIASLATAGGTLVLAVATFSSTRSANRAARISEQSLKVGLRPVLFNARPQDPPQKVGYGDDHWVVLRDGLGRGAGGRRQHLSRDAAAQRRLWHRRAARLASVAAARRAATTRTREVEDFRTQTRDLYVPAGDISFWQAALRDREDELYAPVREAIADGGPLSIDLLYGDHEGGQRTITRFYMIPRQGDARARRGPWMRLCTVSRHWNIDRADPR